MIEYYEVVVSDDVGKKEILIIVDEDNLVSHIYTIDLTSTNLAEKKPVRYKESVDRVKSRLSAKDNTEIYEISRLQALDCAFRANRTSVAASILKKMRSYRRQGLTKEG